MLAVFEEYSPLEHREMLDATREVTACLTSNLPARLRSDLLAQQPACVPAMLACCALRHPCEAGTRRLRAQTGTKAPSTAPRARHLLPHATCNM